MRPLRSIPMLQRLLGVQHCAWAVTLWSPGITGWTIRRILSSSRPKLCFIPCSRSGNTYITSSRMDVHTDNRVLKSALENGGCRSSEVNGVLKDIFRSCREYNFSLDVYYVPSGENPADLPSRSRSDTDCMLSNSAWGKSKAFSGALHVRSHVLG